MELREGRVAFVTGGAAGIGQAVAKMLADHGVSVASFDNGPQDNQDPRIACFYCDCQDPDSIVRAFEAALGVFGKVDILVNNAGDFVYSRVMSDSFEAGMAGLRRMMALFVEGTYAFTSLAAPVMAAAGEGAIINVLTNHLHRDVCRVSPEEHAYDAAKYAQMSLNMSTAVELHPHGIRVNAVDPGATYTKMLRDFFVSVGVEPTVEEISKRTRLGSVMMPEDVALAVCNLLRWSDPAPVGKNYLLQLRQDCEQLAEPPVA